MNLRLVRGKFEEIDPQEIGKVDLIFADPPDNLKVQYDSYRDDLPSEEYRKLLKRWLAKCCLMTGGPVFYCFNERYIPDVEDAIREHNLNLIQRCWWRFSFGQHNSRRYTPVLRPCYWLNNRQIFPEQVRVPSARQEKYGDARAAEGGRVPECVWDFSRICGTFKERRKWHKCQIPERLMRQIILGHSRPGDVIYDPFVGSGSTVYPALELQRAVIGSDASQFYLDKIAAEVEKRRAHIL